MIDFIRRGRMDRSKHAKRGNNNYVVSRIVDSLINLMMHFPIEREIKLNDEYNNIAQRILCNCRVIWNVFYELIILE